MGISLNTQNQEEGRRQTDRLNKRNRFIRLWGWPSQFEIHRTGHQGEQAGPLGQELALQSAHRISLEKPQF